MDKILSLPVSIVFLCLAIIFYALAGSPTPDNPGLFEIIIGALLILAVLSSAFGKGLSLLAGRNFYLKSLQVFFLSGLIFPTAAGVYYNNDPMLILRDVIAFSFLALPLFLSEKISANEGAEKIIRGFILLCGLAFAVRTLIPAFNIWIPQGELLYLSNSPLCLFAAVFLVCALFNELRDIKKASVLKTILMLGAVCVILAAMLLDVQRATIGAVIISVAVFALVSFISSPRRTLLPLFILGVLIAAFYPLIAEMLAAMAEKTAAVGWNMRLQESRAVFDYLAASPERFFLGAGWGAVFASPAVGGLDVNYTHSFLTTMALKGGLVLLLIAMIVFISAMIQIVLIFQRDRVLSISLFWPLVIPVLLYASHKSLDFGLILLLIGVGSIRGQTLHNDHASDKKHETLI